jgi:hypothetical protein
MMNRTLVGSASVVRDIKDCVLASAGSDSRTLHFSIPPPDLAARDILNKNCRNAYEEKMRCR